VLHAAPNSCAGQFARVATMAVSDANKCIMLEQLDGLLSTLVKALLLDSPRRREKGASITRYWQPGRSGCECHASTPREQAGMRYRRRARRFWRSWRCSARCGEGHAPSCLRLTLVTINHYSC
jgi:hypothetical protein